ncbi:hypothetical protein EYC80_004814 [Monilinia laxa]|uniref:Uncharacterized protein n=1 Tax=Monilinia laxa TaxID=61186 RepID=A0A5N6KI68_MONLA|nr:hypothetical protein EYC80_004814 [Monilinia laxa]
MTPRLAVNRFEYTAFPPLRNSIQKAGQVFTGWKTPDVMLSISEQDTKRLRSSLFFYRKPHLNPIQTSLTHSLTHSLISINPK